MNKIFSRQEYLDEQHVMQAYISSRWEALLIKRAEYITKCVDIATNSYFFSDNDTTTTAAVTATGNIKDIEYSDNTAVVIVPDVLFTHINKQFYESRC